MVARAQGLIHRDIKPSNLLLSKQGQVKVLDLGLARLVSDGPETRQLTQSGQVLGTPDFMAPEQWDNTHAVDHRADLYALGCTLCFLLTGRAPFGDERHSTMSQKMKGHLLDPAPRLRELRDDIPQELDDLYVRLIEKEPTERLITAEETATLLKQIAQRQTTKASPPAAAATAAQPAPPTLPGSQGSAATQAWTAAEGALTAASPEATQLKIRPRQKSQAAAALPRRRHPLVLAAAGGAAVVLLLLGVIVVKIVNKDGTTTEVRVPEGSSVEVLKDGKTVAKVDAAKDATKTAPSRSPSAPPPANSPPPANAPPLAIAPFDAAKARAHQEAWAKHLGGPVEFTNSIGMKFRLIPPGEFTMGMTKEEAEALAAVCSLNEHWTIMARSSAPAHKVRLTKPFYIGTYEVTQEQYEKVAGVNRSRFSKKGEGTELGKDADPQQHPVETVSYYAAAEFCTKLSQQEKLKPMYFVADNAFKLLPGDGYRLPTEAEWEWACRAGTNTNWSHGEQVGTVGTVAWIVSNSSGRTHPVGQLKANPFGLYDMHGNVWEWCQDFFDEQTYSERGPGPTEDPQGPDVGTGRVKRGGDWSQNADNCRSAFRYGIGGGHSDGDTGFRVLVGVNAYRPSR